ncbi:MAG: tRNA-intron lyase [Candidatus Bathyarchaeota archaeon]|nr:tRNA-intron lyase [Candidatus Bathyarchaeota archaeon]
MLSLLSWKVKDLAQPRRETNVNRNTELKKTKALLREKDILVSSEENEAIERLSSRGYGVSENEKLTLSFYEALFLLSKGIIEIKDKKTKKKIDFETLLQRYQSSEKNAWVKYLIYRDLRSRGYVAREGFGLGIDFRVYERGEYGKETATYLIFGIQEGQPVSVEELARALNYVQSLKKKLVLAVLNRRGEVVYYSISQLTLK